MICRYDPGNWSLSTSSGMQESFPIFWAAGGFCRLEFCEMQGNRYLKDPNPGVGVCLKLVWKDSFFFFKFMLSLAV